MTLTEARQQPADSSDATAEMTDAWLLEAPEPALGAVHMWFEAPTPVGPAFVTHRLGWVSCLRFSTGPHDRLDAETFKEHVLYEIGADAIADRDPDPQLVARVSEALLRGRTDVPVDLSSRSPFFRQVLRATARIPRGEVRTYAELAEMARRPRAARAVGNAMARNPVPLLVPCHRVVPSSGGVGNYGYGPRVKAELLRIEGAATPAGARR